MVNPPVSQRAVEQHVAPYFHLSACRRCVGDPGQMGCSPGELGTAPSRKPQEFRKRLQYSL